MKDTYTEDKYKIDILRHGHISINGQRCHIQQPQSSDVVTKSWRNGCSTRSCKKEKKSRFPDICESVGVDEKKTQVEHYILK